LASPIALADVPLSHPCLWGNIHVARAARLITARHARLLPTRRTGSTGDDWWRSKYQGAVDAQNQPITALTDCRGSRHIYPMLAPDDPRLLDKRDVPLHNRKRRDLVFYGGSIYEHFGHLVLDLTRLYQLLPLVRNNKAPIWFHYPRLEKHQEITHPLVLEWLDCLGIRNRARVIQREMLCDYLISSEVLYRDRSYVRTGFLDASRHALHHKLRRRLMGDIPKTNSIAYLSRHRLGEGTTRFEGEEEVVSALRSCGNIDVICPEEISIEAKIALYRKYKLITGFAQACMNMKYFAPYQYKYELANQLMFVAGPNSLSSNWVNLERAAEFGDQVLDCSHPSVPHSFPGASPADRDAEGDAAVQTPTNHSEQGQDGPPTHEETNKAGHFLRSNRFNVGLVIDTLRRLNDQ
jgi:hypothetical protein